MRALPDSWIGKVLVVFAMLVGAGVAASRAPSVVDRLRWEVGNIQLQALDEDVESAQREFYSSWAAILRGDYNPSEQAERKLQVLRERRAAKASRLGPRPPWFGE